VSDHGLPVTHVGRTPASRAGGRPEGGEDPAARDEAQPDRVQPIFHFDLGSPEAYLAAERVMAELPVAAEWTPILAAGLPGGGAPPGDAPARRAGAERRAGTQHVQPLRWPPGWEQADMRQAMVATTYAKQIGRAVAFSLAAFRQAFAGGRTLDEDTILIAAAACEMHPRAVLQALGRRSVAQALDDATQAAAASGVRQVPAIVIGELVVEGDDAVERAAALLAERAAPA
jgi:2-hydroxychromene-2-carboxylate isomerase